MVQGVLMLILEHITIFAVLIAKKLLILNARNMVILKFQKLLLKDLRF